MEATARSLKACGLQKGDTIIVHMGGVPEFLYLFFAAETIGVNLKNKIGARAVEIVEIVNESDARYLFVPDYMPQEDAEYVYENTNLEHIVPINPMEHTNGDFSGLRRHIQAYLRTRYVGEKTDDRRNLSWRQFLSLGKHYQGEIYTASDADTRLFSAYTSGSTGARKEVIHSSQTILGMLNQMVFPTAPGQERDTWLWPILPPSLVAVIVAYMCMPLAAGRLVILDPYFDKEDTDLEVMHYKPSTTGLILVLLEKLLDSRRIPEDHDMGYLKNMGSGAEALTRNVVRRYDAFAKKHNCSAQLTMGFGISEAGSQMTIAMGTEELMTGTSGIPLVHSMVSVFEPGTDRELQYGQVGEICKCGPGIMLGYANPEDTAKTIKLHGDGNHWLHTGDLGMMTPEGHVFVYGREAIHVPGDKDVYPLLLENKISDLPGVKNAIIVPGGSEKHRGFGAVYLFVVPFEEYRYPGFLEELTENLKTTLLPEELPEKIWLLDSKPISYFKVDRKGLRKEYGIPEV